MVHALTSFGATLLQAPLRQEVVPRVLWLIRLRYLAVAGVGVVLVLAQAFPVQFYLSAQLALMVLLLISNLIYHQIARRLDASSSVDVTHWGRLAYAQISVDFLILSLQIHYAGGIENPFSIYYVFHTVFAGLLLSPYSAFMEATWGVVLYAVVLIFEAVEIVPHYPLIEWLPKDLYRNPWAIVVAILPLASVMYFLTYLSASIAKTIGEKEDRRTALQMDLRKRSDELAIAYNRLESAGKARELFLVTVEHELKSPLAAIRSNLEAILAAGGELPEIVRDMIVRSSHRAGELLDLVRDLLALSKVERELDERVQECIDFSSLVRDEVELIRPLADQKGLELIGEIQSNLMIWGSSTAARYCVCNLLSNAVRYTTKGSISVLLKRENETIMFQVRDSGIGIAKIDRERIFQEFYRTQAAKRATAEGTGVGLTIVKRALDVLKGRIEVESEVGVGSTFTVILPGEMDPQASNQATLKSAALPV